MMKMTLRTARDHVAMARLIGWPALEASWQATLDSLFDAGAKARHPKATKTRREVRYANADGSNSGRLD